MKRFLLILLTILLIAAPSITMAAQELDANADGKIDLDLLPYVDEDTMSSDSAILLPTEQSVKAYVDTQVATKIGNVVEDTTPQLGGDLDLNGSNIDFPSTPNISDVLDEDAMGSDSATALATQQSIKAYVDSSISGLSSTYFPLSGGTITGTTLLDDGSGASPSLVLKNEANAYSALYISATGDLTFDNVAGSAVGTTMYLNSTGDFVIIPATDGKGLKLSDVGFDTSVVLYTPDGTSNLAIAADAILLSDGTYTFSLINGTLSGSLSWTLPTAAPGGSNYLLNVDADGTMGYTDPSSLSFSQSGDYTPTGTWDWSGVNGASTWPTFNQNTTGTAANVSGTPALPNGTTATTQTDSDNSTKLATTAYVDSMVSGSGGLPSNFTASGNDLGATDGAQIDDASGDPIFTFGDGQLLTMLATTTVQADMTFDDGSGDSPVLSFQNESNEYTDIYEGTAGGLVLDGTNQNGGFIFYTPAGFSLQVIPGSDGYGLQLFDVGNDTSVLLGVADGTTKLHITGDLVFNSAGANSYGLNFTNETGDTGAIYQGSGGELVFDNLTSGGNSGDIVFYPYTAKDVKIVPATDGHGLILYDVGADTNVALYVADGTDNLVTSGDLEFADTKAILDASGDAILTFGDGQILTINASSATFSSFPSIPLTENYFLQGNGSGVAAAVSTLSNLTFGGFLTSRAIVSDGSGELVESSTTAAQIGYLSTLSSDVQTQINAKAPSASPTLTTPDIGAATGTSLAVTGTVSGLVPTDTQASGKTLATADYHGGTVLATGAGSFTLPTAAAGLYGCVEAGQGVTAIIGLVPASGDYIVADGARGTVATEFKSDGSAGDRICYRAYDTDDWYVSYVGTWAE